MNWLEQVKQVFDQVSEMPPIERAAFLDRECASEPQLRAEIEALLAAETEAGDFLATPLLSAATLKLQSNSQPGRVIGRYRLLEEIGHGGMATVYLAERVDGEYRQQVALKLVWSSAHSEEIRRRFKQERQILASLDHPNIARLLDGGATEDGSPFLVMEYIAGQSITRYCQERNLPIVERLQLFQTVCAAVAYAHRNLIVHRDIKPGNILVTETGTVKLLDFGIAKLLAPGLAEQQTITGFLPMTPEYASPEQLREETLTTATDVYSLGVLLYELLTGSHPHDLKERPMHDLIRIVCEADPPPPSSRIKQLRGDLDNIVLLALRKEPGQRYQTVEQFREDVERFLAGEPILARPSTLRYRAGKYLRRNKTAVVAATIVLLLLLGMLANEMRRARRAEAEAYERNRQIYAFDMDRALEAWQENDLAGMNATLEKYWPKPSEEDWRGFEWRYLWRLAHQDERTIEFPERILDQFLFQGERQLALRSENQFKVFDLATGKEALSFQIRLCQGCNFLIHENGLRVIENGREINTYDLRTGQRRHTFRDDGAPFKQILPINEREFFTLDETGLIEARDQHTAKTLRGFHIPANSQALINLFSAYLASMNSNTVTLWEWQTGRLAVSFAEPDEIEGFGATKTRLYLKLKSSQLSLRDLRSGRLITRITAGQKGVMTGAASADETLLATGGLDGSVQFWDMATGRELGTLSGRHRDWIRNLEFSLDGKWLASSSNDRTIKLWDVAARCEVVMLKGHDSEVDTAGFTSDSRRLISQGYNDRILKVWDLASVLQPTVLTGHGDYIYAVAVSPDNQHIASVSKDHTAILWDLVTGEWRVLRGHKDQVFVAAFSPDGKLLATGGNEGIVIIWDVASGQEIGRRFNNMPAQPPPGIKYTIRSLTFSPDGRTLLIGSGDGRVKLWDWGENRQLREFMAHNLPNKPEPEVVSLRFSPDGKLLATASMEGTAKIWDFATGNLIATLTGHTGYVWAAVFSPDGKLLATCGHDRTIKLWDTATWREVATLTGHSNEVFSVAFTPDGSRLASASNDHTVKLWNVARRQEVLTLKDHTDQVWSVAFTPDGHTMVTGSWDKTVRLYRAATDQDLLKHARK